MGPYYPHGHPYAQQAGLLPPNGPGYGQRWHDGLPGDAPGPAPGPGPLGLVPAHGPSIPPHRILHDDRFLEPHGFPHAKSMIYNPELIIQQVPQRPNLTGNAQDGPRYTKWRERRDAITNLDRQTAQSSSRTDSLKTSLQQQTDNKSRRQQDQRTAASGAEQSSKHLVKDSPANGHKKSKTREKVDPQDISDGEIVDDESSDDEEIPSSRDDTLDTAKMAQAKGLYSSRSASQQCSSIMGNKRRRGDAEPDYETISDEELDDFMTEKKDDDVKSLELVKSSSELELLNALGLDWANLVEMSKQSRKEANTAPGAALRGFAIENYVPTLGISKKLAGPHIYELIMRVSHFKT